MAEHNDAGHRDYVPAYVRNETVPQLRECRTVGAGLVLAEDYARRWRKSKQQAAHILNVAVHYGAVEKVRLRSVGIDPKVAGAMFGYRPTNNAHTAPQADG